MSQTALRKLDLKRYTICSLQFCGTAVDTWRGQRFLTAVNQWYFPLIRSGWPVPLSFVIDVCALLLSPHATAYGFGRDTDLPAEDQALSKTYRATLDAIRRHPVFQSMAELLRGTRDEALQSRAVRTFLEFLVSGVSGFSSIYSFTDRDVRLKSAVLSREEIAFVLLDGAGKPASGRMKFRTPAAVRNLVEAAAIRDVLRMLCDYFAQNPIGRVFTEDHQLVVKIASQTPAGTGRVDYRLLAWLLGRGGVEDVEQHPPYPRLVDEVLPTNAYQTDGSTGGYIDVYRKRFAGSLAEILPVEMGLWRERKLMLQKLLNEGVLTYVRENFEYIERELRVLFCFVIDNDPRLLHVRGKTHQGLTPYVRARSLAAVMLQDLARHLPRIDVLAHSGVFLWSPPDERARRTEPTCRAKLDLFGWTPADAAVRFRFLQGLTVQFPEMFYARVTEEDASRRRHLEASPFEFLAHQHQSHRYHCRHVVWFTSAETAERLLGERDLHLNAHNHGPDSIHVITCDHEDATVGVSRPGTLYEAADDVRRGTLGRISEERLRQQFLEAVLLKGAGKPLTPECDDLLDDLM